jgi:hypothetical protein
MLADHTERITLVQYKTELVLLLELNLRSRCLMT